MPEDKNEIQKDEPVKTSMEKIDDFLNEELNKKRPEYIYHLSPAAQKLYEDALKELYPDKIRLIEPK